MTGPPAESVPSVTPEPVPWVRRLLRSCGRHRTLTTWVVVTAVLATGLSAAAPLVMRLGLDDAVSGRTDRIPLLAGGLGLAAVLQFGGAFARQFLAAKLALEVQHDLRTQAFASLQGLDGGKQDSLRTGQVMSRANLDLQMVQGLLSQVPLAIGSVVLVGVSFAAMIWLSPLMTVIHLLMVAACAVISLRSSRGLSPATWAVQHRSAVIAQLVGESVAGAYVVQGFGQESTEVRRFTDQARTLFAERLRVAKLQSWPMANLQSMPLLAQVAVLLLGGWLAVNGRISLGDFVAFAAFTTTLTAPAAVISNLVVVAQLARPAVERVYDLLDLHSEVEDAADAGDVPAGALAVALDDVTFGYTRDEPVLRGLSLRVEPGETVALVGPSGSGKSTVALLLTRFYDVQHGRVQVGPAGAERDVRDVRLASLRQRVGVVFEEPFLFAGSIRGNIAYGHPQATDEQIRAMARAAGAAEFIERLPDGYDTHVGERGATLSGGQRQRIALARTLLSDPAVLVLDDATSAVDAATADAIQQALGRATAGRTTVVIAHRRATLSLADRIIVLEHGSVVDQGTQSELLDRCSLFRELFTQSDLPAAQPDVTTYPLDTEGVTPELWAGAAPAPAEAEQVWLDGMLVERQQAADVAALPLASDRPAQRLEGAPPADEPPPRSLFAILGPVRGLVAGAVALMACNAAVTSLLPALVRRGIDGGVAQRDMSGVWSVAALSLVIVGLNWLVLFWQPRLISRTGESALFRMRVRSFRHLHSLGLDHFQGSRAGALLTRMTTDITSLADFVEAGLTVAAVNLLTVGVMAAAMLTLAPTLALYGFSLLPVLVVATLVFRRLSAPAYERTRDQIGEVNADLQENLEGLRTAQSHGQQAGAGEHFGGLSSALKKLRLKAQSYAAAYFPFVGLLSDATIIVVLAVGSSRVAAGSLTPGVLTAFLLYLGLFYAPFQQLSLVFDGYQRAKVGAHRIAELLDTPSSITQPVEPQPVPRDGLRGDVTLREVEYRYADSDTAALREVSVTVPAGRRIALVGATGSGKSTLVKLVARLYDVSGGVVEVDGVDVRNYDLAAYRGRIGVVPQEAHLFTRTVAENIRFSRPTATDAEVQAAAAAVGALPMVAALPSGFQHQVAERGSGLSTGQRQLVALARARLADPDILLLDEPTASLDPVAEEAVLRGMDQVSVSRTTFLVTHRLASAARCDRVLVLAEGRIVEEGTPAELLTRDGPYARLWALEQGVDELPPADVRQLALATVTGEDAVGVDGARVDAGVDAPAEVAKVEDPGHPGRGRLRALALVGARLIQLVALARQVVVSLTNRRAATALRRSTSAAEGAPAEASPPGAGPESDGAAGRT